MFFRKVVSAFVVGSVAMTSWLGVVDQTDAKEVEKKDRIKSNFQYENLENYFTGFDGSFVLYDTKQSQYTIYNKEKSVKRVSPNSTFKVPHALIGLQTGVLKDENTTFKWDGTVYPFAGWNQDQTLKMAIQNSTIWYFQSVAERIGAAREQFYLNAMSYGNRDISGGLTNFWLQSSLKISPLEQVEFLKRFVNYQLPFSKQNIDIVKQILVMEQKNGAVLSGKTGTGWKDAVINGVPINGWFVGYVEKEGNTYIFATNIEAENNATSGKAKEITFNILRDKHIYE
ncbi:class D beta-lactamase [Shimazuella kribbensis]|uniref:class D beta-lactamase n=1 Tax=Shimazuella kribbensis TaxID=139808 RepID=UPI000400F720|nr:class D beta-lactamase [Shimazuella kribbensis]